MTYEGKPTPISPGDQTRLRNLQGEVTGRVEEIAVRDTDWGTPAESPDQMFNPSVLGNTLISLSNLPNFLHTTWV